MSWPAASFTLVALVLLAGWIAYERTPGGSPRTTMITSEEVAAALADLAERSAVPLRVPVGAAAEHILAARDAAPYDRPFVRG